MKLVLHAPEDTYQIRAYSPGKVVVNDETFRRSLVVAPHRIIRDWPPNTIAALATTHLDAVLELAPDLVLLGTGQRLSFPQAETLQHLARAGVGYEVMDTPAACRTYSVLSSEGRSVAAALILEGD